MLIFDFKIKTHRGLTKSYHLKNIEVVYYR